MGVADNKTYKNDYIFTENKITVAQDNPSINDEPKINSTIKENPYRANVEIEGKEIVLQDDLSALFNAVGKRHSKGGMDVLLKPNAFVFSDFNELKITPEEHELFELKEGGTPAQTVKKNVNPKHYNTLTNILNDPNKDDLAKKTAMRMVEKYLGTLGNIAYLQESKKGFPQGLPEFAANTAPVFDDDLDEKIDSNKQYAKAGGSILPKAQMGIPLGIKQMIDAAKSQNIGSGRLTTSKSKRYSGPSGSEPQVDISGTGIVQDDILKDLMKSFSTKFDYVSPWKTPESVYQKQYNYDKSDVGDPQVEKVTGDAQGSIKADWQFTPWQKLSQMYNWGQYANVKRYMPFRSHFDATYTDPALLNPEQQIGDMRGVANQQISALGTLNPILRNAQAAGTTGELLNQIAQVRSQYDNQNAQILNQTRQYNNQLRNQETQTNMVNDQQYYKEAVEGRKNFENMRQFTANNAFNNTLRDVETNQKLAYNLLTQNNPAYGFDWKTGQFTRNKKSILDAQGSQTNSIYNDIIEGIKRLPDSDPKKWEIYERILRQKNILPYLQQSQVPDFFSNSQQKKGGRIGKNPYKNNTKY